MTAPEEFGLGVLHRILLLAGVQLRLLSMLMCRA